MNMNQLARNSQVQAARQRLAAQQGMVPGGAQQGNVAGCGSLATSGWPPQQGYPIFAQSPQNCPPIPTAQGPVTLRQFNAKLSAIVRVEAVGDTTCVEISCKGGSVFYGSGIRTMNDCFQVLVESMQTGSLQYDLICGDPIDACYWNTDECYCAEDIGCVTNVSPLTICFSAFGTPSVLPYLNMVIVGCRDSGWQDCGFTPDFYPPGTGYVPPGGGGGGFAGPPNIAGMPGGGGYAPVG